MLSSRHELHGTHRDAHGKTEAHAKRSLDCGATADDEREVILFPPRPRPSPSIASLICRAAPRRLPTLASKYYAYVYHGRRRDPSGRTETLVGACCMRGGVARGSGMDHG